MSHTWTYRSLGEDKGGSIIVLLHGFPMTGDVFADLSTMLASKHPVVVPDLPGFVTGVTPDTIDGFVEQLRTFLEEDNLTSCVLGGLSMGGYIALAYARKYPGELTGLILLDSKAAADDETAKAGRDKNIALAKEKGAKAIAEAMVPKQLSPSTPADSVVAQTARTMMEGVPVPAIVNALTAMKSRRDQTDLLATLDLPVLVVVGADDSITPPDVAKALVEKLPQGTLAIIENAGHLAALEQPGAVGRAILNWL